METLLPEVLSTIFEYLYDNDRVHCLSTCRKLTELNPFSNSSREGILKDVSFFSVFNQEVEIPLIRSLRIGFDYNQPLILPSTLVYLELSYKFNQPLVLPSSLVTLIFNCDYPHPIFLPETLERLKMLIDGDMKDTQIFPIGLKHLSLPSYSSRGSKQRIDFPKGLKSLEVDCLTSRDSLPESLEVLKINGCGGLELPRSLVELDIYTYDYPKGLDLPKRLQKLRIGPYKGPPLVFPEGLEDLTIISMPEPWIFPNSLKRLSIGSCPLKPYQLPPKLEVLELMRDYDWPLDLPKSLKELDLGRDYTLPLDLHEGLLVLNIGASYNLKLDLPKSLQRLVLGESFHQHLDLHEGLLCLELFLDYDLPIIIPRSLERAYLYTHQLPLYDFPDCCIVTTENLDD